MSGKSKVAIIGSGNIGTDLMIKVMRLSSTLEMGALVGIDPKSDGLARAARMGVAVTHEGVHGLRKLPVYQDIELVFDATSAGAHARNSELVTGDGKRMIDMTPAAIGPFVVPPVNLTQVGDQPNVNMVTCGGQATIPVVAAMSAVTTVHYAEIIASIASRSAGPGTRANIDEFTVTTARAIEAVGGAKRGKAIIILNPAEPPLIMRDTVHCIVSGHDHDGIRKSVEAMVENVRGYVPGYRLKQAVQFEHLPADAPARSALGVDGDAMRVTVLLEVEGAGHYLPAYAGNLDIMTSAALRVGESLVAKV